MMDFNSQHSDKKSYTGAELVVRILLDEGVDTVFGYPGGQVLDIYDALAAGKKRIRHILTAHEQGAAHAADGYARASGKTGVVIATSGPGAANLVTGIATAYLDSSPIVAITGNVPTSQIGRDSFQELDIADITMPVTKHNYIVKDVRALPSILHEAFKIAADKRKGPVLVDIPRDIQSAKIPRAEAEALLEESKNEITPSKKGGIPSGIDDALEIISKAERPFVYCGGGAVSADAGELVEKLAEKLSAPVGCSLMGLPALTESAPGKLGLTGMHGLRASTEAFCEADTIIAVGTRFTDRATGARGELVRNAKIVQLDIDPAEIDKNVTDAAFVIGDIHDSLYELLKRLPEPDEALSEKRREWFTHTVGMYDADLRGEATDTGAQRGTGFLHPREIIGAVSEKTAGLTIVTDVGQHQMWAAQYCPITRPRGFITSGGLGTMGFGMGAAIGASLSDGGKPVVLYTGDGSFGMDLIELATAVSYNIPLMVIIMNNSSLGMVKQWQKMLYRRTSQSELRRKTDFVKVAEAFGANGVRVTDMNGLRTALDRAVSLLSRHRPVPFVIDCVIDPDERVLPVYTGK